MKSRRHEGLIRDFGGWASGRGFTVSTAEHPKDLVLRRAGHEWLVEGKVIYRGNATLAVRAAIGQLFMYRRFLPHRSRPSLLALFTEPVGDLFVAFLSDIGIDAAWREKGRWLGSAGSVSAGLAENGVGSAD